MIPAGGERASPRRRGESAVAGLRADQRSVRHGDERIALGQLVVLGRVGHEVEHRPVGVGELARGDRPAAEVPLGIGQDARAPDVAEPPERVGRARSHVGARPPRQHAVLAKREV